MAKCASSGVRRCSTYGRMGQVMNASRSALSVIIVLDRQVGCCWDQASLPQRIAPIRSETQGDPPG